ncbi:MAG: LysM peptidoglycan-binding domain-containing protein [Muribaculaceae bacterium]|nr:LysM peptidoglycan-binding domain-containing protein [Muribaculaceae bacterium]
MGSTRVNGSSTAHNIWGIPVGTPNPQKAIDNALAKYPGAIGLTNGVMKANYWWAILYGQHKITVEGTPLYPSGNTIYQTPQQSKPYIQPAAPTYVQPTVPVYEQPAQPATPSEPTSNEFVHEVKAGDTLVEISKQYGVSLSNIIKWNKLTSNTLTPGQNIKIIFENK